MLIFLYGEDSFRSRNKLNELKEKFLREIDPQGNSLSTIDGSMANFSQINESISPSSLFASKRMVVIENIFANSKKTSLAGKCQYHQCCGRGDGCYVWREFTANQQRA